MKEYIDSYEKLPVGKYMELKEVLEDKEADEYDKNIAIVSILTDIDEVDVYNLPLNEFNNLLQLSSFLTEKPTNKIVEKKYRVGKYELEPVLGTGEMTTAQFIDYQTLIKDFDANFVSILAIFLIPSGKKYNQGYDLTDVENEIREHLMITDALSISSFFFLLFKSLLKITVTSLERQIKKMKRKKIIDQETVEKLEKEIALLQASGDGLR